MSPARGVAAEGGALDATAAWRALATVTDPEIPVLSITEMGLVRSVTVADGGIRVAITPTFSACPALEVIRREVERALAACGFAPVEVVTVLSPPWSSDRLEPSAREKLRAFGIAPPAPHGGLVDLALEAPAACPRCGSLDSEVRNAFGPTLCRSIHWCRACGEPFEAFKPL